MASAEMLMVFTYDVSSSKRRRKVARTLEEHATRVQYSVFEARMSRKRADAIAAHVERFLGSGDSLRVYAIGANGLKRSQVVGAGVAMDRAEGYWLL